MVVIAYAMLIDNANKAIGMLESINASDEFAYEKAFLAFMSVKKLPVFVYKVNSGITVFRTRPHLEDTFFQNIWEISVPPKELIKNFARCNRPGQVKFYCSENRPTSYMELVNYWSKNRNVGEKVFATIGLWKVMRPISTLIVTSPHPDKRVSEFDRTHGEGFDYILSRQDPEVKEASILICDYLFEKFRKSAYNDPKIYIITSAYCNVALSRGELEVDAIYYPSVQFAGGGVNFAFNQNFLIDNNIKLIDVVRDEFEIYLNDEEIKSFQQTGNVVASYIDYHQNKIYW